MRDLKKKLKQEANEKETTMSKLLEKILRERYKS